MHAGTTEREQVLALLPEVAPKDTRKGLYGIETKRSMVCGMWKLQIARCNGSQESHGSHRALPQITQIDKAATIAR